MIRFLHTADWQIGMPFHRVPGDRGARLRELRLEAISTLGRLAREREAEFCVVAGDLFDAHTIEDRVLCDALERIAEIERPVYVLPGNHDHLAAGPLSLWERPAFRQSVPENLVLLDSREPRVVSNGWAVLLPAPLFVRHEPGDPTDHIDATFGEEAAPGAVRIGVAHGTIRDFDVRGGSPNLIDPARARRGALDYLALGDWHGVVQVDERTWYSGAPEPTSFRGAAETAEAGTSGRALLVEIEKRGATPRVEALECARSRWLCKRAVLESDGDVARLADYFEDLPRTRDTLLRLELEGQLALAENARLEELLEAQSERLLRLDRSAVSIVPAPSPGEIDEIATDGYLRRTVDRLRALAALPPEEAQESGVDPRTAADALALLYRLHAEAAC